MPHIWIFESHANYTRHLHWIIRMQSICYWICLLRQSCSGNKDEFLTLSHKNANRINNPLACTSLSLLYSKVSASLHLLISSFFMEFALFLALDQYSAETIQFYCHLYFITAIGNSFLFFSFPLSFYFNLQ